jgi:hypothetical protein
MGTTERHLIRGRDSHQDIVAAVVTIIGCAAKVRESPNVSEALYTNALSLDHLLNYGLPKS